MFSDYFMYMWFFFFLIAELKACYSIDSYNAGDYISKFLLLNRAIEIN